MSPKFICQSRQVSDYFWQYSVADVSVHLESVRLPFSNQYFSLMLLYDKGSADKANRSYGPSDLMGDLAEKRKSDIA